MKTSSCILAVLMVLVSNFACHARFEEQEKYKWDFDKMGKMDSLSLWAGTQPEDMTISKDCIEGEGSLQCSIDLDSSEKIRIEHNFIDGYYDVGAYLHNLNGKTEDFSKVKTIEFSYKTDLSGNCNIVFSIWDRICGWCSWKVGVEAKTGSFKTESLSIPENIAKRLKIDKVGGVTFEIRADNGNVKGKILFDGLKFLEETKKGIDAQAEMKPSINYGGPVHSMPLKESKRKPPHIIMFAGLTNHLNNGDYEKSIRVLEESINRFRGIENIEFWFYAGEYGFLMKENLTDEEKAKLAKVRQVTIDVAKWCQANKLPFYMGPGHITPIMIKADWMKEILDAAPTYCLGVFMHEYSPEGNEPLQEMLDMLDLLKERNKVLILNNQTSYFFTFMWPGCEKYRKATLDEKYKDVYVPMWENLLPAAQGLCMGSCLGYWRSGIVNNWGVSIQSWGYANLNYGTTDQMPADWWLRMLVSSAAYGANYIEIEPDWPFDGEHLKDKLEGGYLLKLSEEYKLPYWQSNDRMKALRWFDHLLVDNALVGASSPKDVVSLSNVVLQFENSENLGKTGFFERGLDIRFNQSHCPTHYEMAAMPKRGDIFRSVYDSTAHYDQTFPKTPYGLVSIHPADANLTGLTVFKTDGFGVKIDDKWLPAAEGESVSISLRDEIAEVSGILMDNASTEEERALLKEAADRILSRYTAAI